MSKAKSEKKIFAKVSSFGKFKKKVSENVSKKFNKIKGVVKDGIYSVTEDAKNITMSYVKSASNFVLTITEKDMSIKGQKAQSFILTLVKKEENLQLLKNTLHLTMHDGFLEYDTLNPNEASVNDTISNEELQFEVNKSTLVEEFSKEENIHAFFNIYNIVNARGHFYKHKLLEESVRENASPELQAEVDAVNEKLKEEHFEKMVKNSSQVDSSNLPPDDLPPIFPGDALVADDLSASADLPPDDLPPIFPGDALVADDLSARADLPPDDLPPIFPGDALVADDLSVSADLPPDDLPPIFPGKALVTDDFSESADLPSEDLPLSVPEAQLNVLKKMQVVQLEEIFENLKLQDFPVIEPNEVNTQRSNPLVDSQKDQNIPKENKIQSLHPIKSKVTNTYCYSGRWHIFTVTPTKFAALKETYKDQKGNDLEGDDFKYQILERLKEQIINASNLTELNEIKIQNNEEINVLKETQGITYTLLSWFGKNTSSMNALEKMLADRRIELTESNNKIL